LEIYGDIVRAVSTDRADFDVESRVTVTLAQRLAQLTAEQRHAVLDGLSQDELAALEFRWEFWRQPIRRHRQATGGYGC
jgi:hypothetical protein